VTGATPSRAAADREAGIVCGRPIAATPALRRAPACRPGVLQIVGRLTPGGTEHLVVEICRRLQDRFAPTVCCLDDEGEWAADLQARGIEVIALRRRPGFRPELGWRIANIARERRIRLLHCHQYSPFVYGRIAKYCSPRLGLLYTEHGRTSDGPPPWKRRVANLALGRFDGTIVAVSDELRRYMVDALFPRDRVGVIYNGIDTAPAATAEGRRRARSALHLDADAFVVATVARLDPVKDLGTLVDAFAVLRRWRPSAQLVIVGDGPERHAIAERAARSDVAGAVHLTGYRSDVRSLLPAADLYVSSSVTEGISLTILEAMASGVPVVATAVGGTPEILSDGTTGILVPTRNPDRLAAAMVALAADPARRAALAAAARRRVETAFTIERMVDEYARAYRRLLD